MIERHIPPSGFSIGLETVNSRKVFDVQKSVCRVRPIEQAGLIDIDYLLSKKDLQKKFPDKNIDTIIKYTLEGLGFVPQNKQEAKLLKLLDYPLIHKYPTGDSPARYFLEVIMGKDALLVSYLPPCAETHPHPHSKEHQILEDYYHIAGNSLLYLDKSAYPLASYRDKPIEVPFDTSHKLKAGEKGALTLIIMKNAGLVSRENWHK